jgi:hypothetical protein
MVEKRTVVPAVRNMAATVVTVRDHHCIIIAGLMVL